MGGTRMDVGTSVASDPAGNVLLAGYTYSPSVDLGGGPLTSSAVDLLIGKYSSTGAPVDRPGADDCWWWGMSLRSVRSD